MDPATLAREMSRFQVVDVRYPNEWEAGHIDGAVHIPGDYVFDRVGELDPDRPVVTVCRTGSRSAEAVKDLAGEGFDVQNLEGGMDAWVAAGLPIRADDGSPGRVVEPVPPPDDRPPEMQKFQNDFMEAAFAVRDHFGDAQPSEEEVLAFLRQRDASRG
jgi:rhodanese-related sulfurtransferase